MKVSVRELKAHLSEYLRHVAAGQDVVVTSRGKPIARLTIPLATHPAPEEIEAEAIARLQSLPWIRPGNGRKVEGAASPIPWKPGQKTLSDMVREDRE